MDAGLCPDLLSTYISPVLDLDPNDVHVPGAITKEGLKSIVCVFGGGWEGNWTPYPSHVSQVDALPEGPHMGT